MHRPPSQFPVPPQMQQPNLMNPNPTYYDGGMQSQPPHQQQPPMFHPSQQMNYNPTGPSSASLSSSLTFTPSGTMPTAFKNIRSTLKSLTENYENALMVNLAADVQAINRKITEVERETMRVQGIPIPSEIETKYASDLGTDPDAEVFALLQERLALDAFQQTAQQALWTARYLQNTAMTHLDPTLELPPSLDNLTLTKLQELAHDQLNTARIYREGLQRTITGMADSMQPPSEEELVKFLQLPENRL